MARKILILAEAANPEWVSVPLVGWSMASALRGVADVHIVTHIRNQGAFERAGLIEGRDFTAINSERVTRPAWKLASLLRGDKGKGWTTLAAINALTYPYFEYLVWKKFGAAITRHDYDIVHRLTPLSPTTTSRLARLCRRANVPFVAGPLNGGVPWPPGFNRERMKEREILSYVRGLYKFLPGHAGALQATGVVLAGSKFTASELSRHGSPPIVYFPENGIDPARFNRMADQLRPGPLRLCFIGRMVACKGLDMALEAVLPFLQDGRASLDLVGDGPLMPEIKDYIRANDIQHAVTLHYWVEHEIVQEIACRCNVLLLPSVKEFGGGAVLEAMALGLVPLVVDYGGPGELVDETRGFKVAIGSRAEIVRAMRERIATIVAHPEDLDVLARTARDWVFSHLTWEAKAVFLAALYEWVLDKSAPLPVFGSGRQ